MKLRRTLIIGMLLMAFVGYSIAFNGCSSSSSGSSDEPVISNVNITPNPVKLGNNVQVAVTYVSPVGSAAETVFVRDVGTNVAIPLTVFSPCSNCTLYFDLDSGAMGRGSFSGEAWVVDMQGRSSNTLVFTITVN